MHPSSQGTDSPKIMFRNEVVAGQMSSGSKTIKRKSRIRMFWYKTIFPGQFLIFSRSILLSTGVAHSLS